jgi:mediator of replication checkpoint protein 1
MDEIFAADDKAKEKETRQQALNARKAAALQAQMAQRTLAAATASTAEDDFEVVAENNQRIGDGNSTIKVQPRRNGPDAKAVLGRNTTSTSPALSRNKQRFLRQAGKSARAKADITETHFDFAAKAWNHANLKNANGGARPNGQKRGREVSIPNNLRDQKLLQNHFSQTAALRKKKEEEWGKSRMLPEKRQPDIQALVAASSKYEPRDESEEEDDDFIPDDDDVDDNMAHSGEEDEAANEDDEAERDDEIRNSVSDDEAGEVAEDVETCASDQRRLGEGAGMATSDGLHLEKAIKDDQYTPKRTVDVASDELHPTPTLRSATPTLQTRPATASQSGVEESELDLGGFGDGEGGFSQLFEATQANTGQVSLRSLIQPKLTT